MERSSVTEATAASAASASAASASAAETGDRRQHAATDQAASRLQLTEQQSLAIEFFGTARYYEDRAAFFVSAGKLANFLTIVAGSAAFAGAFALPALAAASGAIAAIVGAGQLVLDFSGNAARHLECRRRYLDLLRDAERPGADCVRLRADATALYGGEPETYHAANALAWEAAQMRYGRPEPSHVRPWQRAMRHFRRFDPSDFARPV